MKNPKPSLMAARSFNKMMKRTLKRAEARRAWRLEEMNMES